jgi:uncharacterized protein YndB with AHSA1/START domain/dihydrofolate reductase
VPREVVFRAWTEARYVALWWGPHGFTTTVSEWDARPGGAIRIYMAGPDGAVYPGAGMFHEVVSPERLVFTTSAVEDVEGNPGLEVINTVTLTEHEGQTTLTLHARVIKVTPEAAGALDGMAEGWNQTLESLAEYIEQQPGERNSIMGNVTTGFSMSLDGFVALPNDDIGPLFDWYFSGDTAYTVPSGTMEFKVSQESAAEIQVGFQAAGALVAGRRLLEHTKAWGGKHPLDVPVFVVTHSVDGIAPEWLAEGSPFTFVTDGVASAIAQAKVVAGDKSVAVASPTIVQQCLHAGLLDEIHIDLIPVLLGEGIRLFDHLDPKIVKLETPTVVAAPGVTHLTYRVIK